MTRRDVLAGMVGAVLGVGLGAGAMAMKGPGPGPDQARPGAWPWSHGNFTVIADPAVANIAVSAETAAGSATWLFRFPTEGQATEARKRVVETLARYKDEVEAD